MRKSKAGVKKEQPQRGEPVFDGADWGTAVAQQAAQTEDAAILRVAEPEPKPWEIAASRLRPFEDANTTYYDAWLTFQAYHLSEQTLLLRAILQAVEI